MKKNLYSLTLSDEVVREVDALAHRLGTNRSALVNRILSEYVSVPTPERRINDIFEAIEALVSPRASWCRFSRRTRSPCRSNRASPTSTVRRSSMRSISAAARIRWARSTSCSARSRRS
ncbi:MAG: ribbon-helix-helix protein, CopG family [Oscillospiraceae bacterium]